MGARQGRQRSAAAGRLACAAAVSGAHAPQAKVAGHEGGLEPEEGGGREERVPSDLHGRGRMLAWSCELQARHAAPLLQCCAPPRHPPVTPGTGRGAGGAGAAVAHREARGDCRLERRHTCELGKNVVGSINDVHRGPWAAGVVRLEALQPRRVCVCGGGRRVGGLLQQC